MQTASHSLMWCGTCTVDGYLNNTAMRDVPHNPQHAQHASPAHMYYLYSRICTACTPAERAHDVAGNSVVAGQAKHTHATRKHTESTTKRGGGEERPGSLVRSCRFTLYKGPDAFLL